MSNLNKTLDNVSTQIKRVANHPLVCSMPLPGSARATNRLSKSVVGGPYEANPLAFYQTPGYQILATVSMLASGYHGYKRNNDSVGWAIGWGLLGSMFPVITPVVAVVQGFAKPEKLGYLGEMQNSTKILVGTAAAIGAVLLVRELLASDEEEAAATPGEGGTGSASGGGGNYGMSPENPSSSSSSSSPSSATGYILQTVGKHWILTNKISGDKAANYGWHFNGATFGGQKFERSVSLPSVGVVQGIGTRHDRFHSDYSQTCVLAADQVIYQGQTRSLSELLADPEASQLLSVEGPLTVTRQPGVARLDPIVIDRSMPGVSREDVAALPNNLAQRDEIILGWVDQNAAEYSWSDITVGDLTFSVFSDALMFGGVRVNVSATLQQQIADKLSCSLLTARMADLVFQSASKVILPFPMSAGSEMGSTKYMLAESDKVSQAAASTGNA